jgi:hypothetical protein
MGVLCCINKLVVVVFIEWAMSDASSKGSQLHYTEFFVAEDRIKNKQT